MLGFFAKKRCSRRAALVALIAVAAFASGCMLLAAGAVESGREGRVKASRRARAELARCRQMCAESFPDEPARRSLCEDECREDPAR